MRRLALLAGLAVGACGSSEPAAVSPACEGTPASILTALRGAPEAVALDDGTLLSECVARARDDGALQQVGLALTPAAQTLARQRTAAAARRLGFLVGAAHRGGRESNGIQAQLLHKLDGIAGQIDDPELEDDLRRGVAAGEDHG